MASGLRRGRPPFLIAIFVSSWFWSGANVSAETHPYLGASLTVTPSASATSSASDYYTVISTGLSWKPKEAWVHQFGYDFGIDALSGAVTTYSTVSVGTLYRLSDTFRPKFSLQNTFSNNFDFYGVKLKAALRMIPLDVFRIDPGILFYADTVGSSSLGGYFDMNWQCSETWSVQFNGQLLGSAPTEYALGAGVTYDASGEFSLYASVNYSTGISAAPVLGTPVVGSTKKPSIKNPKAGQTTIADYSGTTSNKTAWTLGMLYSF